MLTAHLEQFNEDSGVGLRLTVQVADDDCVLRSRRSWSELIKSNWQMSVAM